MWPPYLENGVSGRRLEQYQHSNAQSLAQSFSYLYTRGKSGRRLQAHVCCWFCAHAHLSGASAAVCVRTCYRKNELEKKRAYEERVREVEHGSFSPLVFSAAGGMGSIASIVYKRLASLLGEKRGNSYSSTLHWLRCRLNFSLLRSAIMCIRGSRSTFYTTPPTESIDLALHEGQVPTF